jgi:DNA-binding FadR family transcriptional regulator
VVNPQATAEENAASETRWHISLAKLAGQPVAGHFLQVMMSMTRHQRTEALSHPGSAQALAEAQLRLTCTLCEGDFASAERLLPTLFNAPLVARAA